ncbi:uncharacterized protein BDR25DRAFT_356516 [Lindgomyces ingoldianus]|uniref:Uncharacterized protein n=1 Tax=Lindgomyces ingoldianus TaxID=673940 RepID=A0ACB6QQS9_9PLEO|nr:uncharacterized protein BDR25DRAFT_356516 [Lindgomyces ingoldianus]KAF2469276.1 hypothetical protein BDR25DRAFT_356516 [Lindgomyces ingoldianus]
MFVGRILPLYTHGRITQERMMPTRLLEKNEFKNAKAPDPFLFVEWQVYRSQGNHRLWYEIRLKHTNTLLTFNFDGLIAISGIISRIRVRTGVAGIGSLTLTLVAALVRALNRGDILRLLHAKVTYFFKSRSFKLRVCCVPLKSRAEPGLLFLFALVNPMKSTTYRATPYSISQISGSI